MLVYWYTDLLVRTVEITDQVILCDCFLRIVKIPDFTTCKKQITHNNLIGDVNCSDR